jgi:hypothetical protein
MFKTCALAAALLTAAAVSALAQTPADKAECKRLAVDLADDPRTKNLSKADFGKFFILIIALAQECDDERFAAAGEIADQIDALLN